MKISGHGGIAPCILQYKNILKDSSLANKQNNKLLMTWVKMELAWSSKTLVSYYITIWHHNPEDHDLNIV
jgi:uncharacterized phage-associated protein